MDTVKFTKEEIKSLSAGKVKEIQDLCKKLQIILVPEEIVTETGLIKKVIFFRDEQNYPQKDA